MKRSNFLIIILLQAVLMALVACNTEKGGEADNPKATQKLEQKINADSIAAANKAKRGQDLVNQAVQLSGVYCKCTERTAEQSRKECKEQVMGAVNQILATLKGDEKTAFENTYNEGVKLCR